MAQGFRRCYKCGFQTTEVVARCPQCGRSLVSSTRLRRLGWAQLLLGLFIVGLMGTITFFVAPIMLQPETGGTGTRFTGTAAQAQAFLLLFGVVIMFGLISMANGCWQIVTGRRNIWIMILGFVFAFLILAVGWAVRNLL